MLTKRPRAKKIVWVFVSAIYILWLLSTQMKREKAMQKSLKWQSSVKRQKCVHAHTWRKLKDSENIDQMINIMNEWREHGKVYRSKRLKTFLTGHVLTYLTVQKEVQLIWIRVWNNNVKFSRLWLIWAFTTAARCTVERKIERASLNSSDVKANKNTRDGLLSQRSWLFFCLNGCHALTALTGAAFDELWDFSVPLLNTKDIFRWWSSEAVL